MVLANTIITYCYYGFTLVIALLLLRKLFKREKRQGLVYDIVYAYCLIPFILRMLQIK